MRSLWLRAKSKHPKQQGLRLGSWGEGVRSSGEERGMGGGEGRDQSGWAAPETCARNAQKCRSKGPRRVDERRAGGYVLSMLSSRCR